MKALVVVAGAYLLGSVPFSYLVVRLLEGSDLRLLGSGNLGATNAWRVAGRRAGTAVLLLDFAKGAVPVIVARFMGLDDLVLAAVAAAAVLGHVYSAFVGFRGGKGVATATGALGALAPLATAVAMVLFFLVVKWTRYVSLGSVVAMASFPVLVWVTARLGAHHPDHLAFVVASGLVPLLVIFQHRGNLDRLLAGTERRLGNVEGATE